MRRPVFVCPKERQNFHMEPVQASPTAQPTGTATPETPAQAAPEQQQQEQQPLTRKDVEEIVGKVFQRVQQSSRDRDRNIEAKVQELTKVVQTAGLQITPDVTAKLREQAEATVDQQPTTPEPAQQAEGDFGPGNPVFNATMDIFKEEGVEITRQDPEWSQVQAGLDDPNGNPVKYAKTLMKAIETKRTRVASQSQNADARTLGGGASSGEVTAKSARDYWQNAH
jgi:hypothetical protein